MNRKIGIVFICFILLIGNILSGCGKSEEPEKIADDFAIAEDTREEQVVEDVQDVQDVQDVIEAEETEESEETGDDWKAAYTKILDELRVNLPNGDDYMADQNTPYRYLIYDIDKDGLPEMLVEFGSCEADYNGKLYKYENGSAVEKEPFSMGHTVFYSVPDENGILFYWGHMGSAFLQKVTMDENGKLTYTELLSEQLDPNTDDDYTDPSEVVPGASYLSMCRIKNNIYINNYEKITAQINKSPEPLAENDIIPNNIEEIVPDILENNGKVYAVSADGYGGDMGPDTEIEKLLAEIDEWSGNPYQVEATAYVDVNNDKQLEAVLKLLETGTDNPSVKWLVMAKTEDTVYAYVINYMEDYKLIENGSFISTDEFYRPFRVEFDHEACMLYEVGNNEGYKEVI